jgi:hypothetical protein
MGKNKITVMKERIKKLLYNNLFLALLLSLPFDAALFMMVSKYRIKEIAFWEFQDKVVFFYNDLDQDGYSEKIVFEKNLIGNSCIKIYNPGHQGQFNFSTRPMPVPTIIEFGDINNDGVNEIFFLGEKDSAVYLNMLDYRTREIREYFVDKVRAIGTTDYSAIIHAVEDFDLDGYRDVLISVSAGFSLNPRALYILNPHTGKSLATPEQGSKLNGNQVFNIDEDSFPEIIVSTFASRNQVKSVPITDSCSWMIVYDHLLHYKFDPVKISCDKSCFSTFPLISEGTPLIAGISEVLESEEIPNRIFLFSGKGEKKLDLPFEKGDPDLAFKVRVFPGQGQDELFYLRQDGSLFRIGTNLKPIFLKKRKILAHCSADRWDLKNDGKPEWIFINYRNSRCVITDPHFNHPVKWEINGDLDFLQATPKLNGSRKPTFYIQTGTTGTEIDYGINPWWYGQIVGYAVLWGFFFLLVQLISRIQRAKLRQQALLQEQMSELQYRVITSQFSPHYTFNVLNAISAKLYGTYPELYDYINRFSRQLRYLYAGRNELQRKLKEELDFCRDYLEIQKLRFTGKFDYEVHLSEDVSQETIIPKMLVFTFVENALKHGLRLMESGGHIAISGVRSDGNIILKVTDNGVGRKAAAEYLKENPQYSTGKGLELLEKLVQQMNSSGKGKISWEMKDREGERGTIAIISMAI